MLKYIRSIGMLLTIVQVATSMNISYAGNCTYKIFSDVVSFNTTSTTSFNMQQLTGNDEAWYFHLALTTGKSAWVYRLLSVPESFTESKTANETRFCAYTIEAQKETPKTTEGNNTCSGVVSSKCEAAFSGITATGSQNVCPQLDVKACNSNLYSALLPKFVKESCHLANIPGLEVPKGYITFELISVGYGGPEEPGSFKNYDEAVKESFPTWLTVLPGSIKSETTVEAQEHPSYSQSICAVPNKVQNGSRQVESSANMLAPATAALIVSLVVLLL